MKIKCNYCDNYFDDTNAVCPNCGAPNDGIVRTNREQPVTIEGLLKWYSDRKLPPFEVTRFFIGENYTQPRAFGIYKDDKSGNVIVYKNKNDGTRAIRYSGTDEAYAVNEILQKLKEEIINQKNNQMKKGGTGAGQNGAVSSGQPQKGAGKVFKAVKAAGIAAAVLIFAYIIFGDSDLEVKHGYYGYDSDIYYCYGKDYPVSWSKYLDFEDDWSYELSSVPEALERNSTAQEYYLGDAWDASIGASDFRQSRTYLDSLTEARGGYYKYGGRTYYHEGIDPYDGWFLFDSALDDWEYIESDSMPDDMRHSSLAQDFYYSPTWDSSVTATNFYDSQAYIDYNNSHESDSKWSNSDDSDYDWSSSDSWDSSSTDFDSDW